MKRPVVIVGAGGHAREVAEIIREAHAVGSVGALLGFIDEASDGSGKSPEGIPVLGDMRWFDGTDRSQVEVICAIGTPDITRRIVERIHALDLEFGSVISPRAWISPHAKLGRGVMVFPNVTVNTGSVIGNFVTLNVGVIVSHDSTVGDFANLNPGSCLAGNVRVGEGCYIGMGANIIQQRTIGPWTTVGAGAVVVDDLPAHSTAVGVPARVIKHHSP